MNKDRSNIILIGMPACGKSYWARQLAIKYGMDLIDMDRLIEVHTGLSTPAIFEQHGETYFREKERELLHKELEAGKKNRVFASGGGTPCFYDNMAVMKSAGTVVYLEASIEQLLKNLESDKTERPLLKAGNVKNMLSFLLLQRGPVYRQADIILPVEDLQLSRFDELM